VHASEREALRAQPVAEHLSLLPPHGEDLLHRAGHIYEVEQTEVARPVI
jgi:hypothetical protein